MAGEQERQEFAPSDRRVRRRFFVFLGRRQRMGVGACERVGGQVDVVDIVDVVDLVEGERSGA